MTKTLYFIQISGDPMIQKSRLGVYSGPVEISHCDCSNRVRTLGTPDLRKMLINATCLEDLEERVNMAEHFFAREVSTILPEGHTGYYYGISYEKAKENFAKYGIIVQKS